MTRIVILPGPDRGLADLINELSDAAGGDARTAVTVGHGGVVTTPQVAHTWLAAYLDVPAPTGTPSGARTGPTADAPPPAPRRQPAKKATKSTAKSTAKKATATKSTAKSTGRTSEGD